MLLIIEVVQVSLVIESIINPTQLSLECTENFNPVRVMNNLLGEGKGGRGKEGKKERKKEREKERKKERLLE